jgi:hypothetical protein
MIAWSIRTFPPDRPTSFRLSHHGRIPVPRGIKTTASDGINVLFNGR